MGQFVIRQQNYEDAIECFDIASSLTPTVATLYNLGLVHYEYGNYEQATVAFEKSVDLEPTAKRYVAYAKALEKIGNKKRVTEALEKAVELEPTQQHRELLALSYERNKEYSKAEEIRANMAVSQARSTSARKKSPKAHSKTPARIH